MSLRPSLLPVRAFLGLAVAALAMAPLQGPGRAHCGHRDGGAVPGSAELRATHAHADTDAGIEDSSDHAECPHCPIQQCPTQVACSVQLAEAPGLTKVRRSPVESLSHAPVLRVQEIFRGLAPPTPPPQPGA